MRPYIALTVDYVLRDPNFIENYLKLKKLILVDGSENEIEGNLPSNDYWQKLRNDVQKIKFYETCPVPSLKDENFDYTFKKYFYNEEDRLKFFEDYNFELYGKGELVTKKIVDYINITQSKLCDVYLYDRLHNSRKSLTTFNWLAKNNLQVKGVIFISPNDSFKDLNNDAICIYDPYTNNNQFMHYNKGNNENNIKEFFYSIENLIK